MKLRTLPTGGAETRALRGRRQRLGVELAQLVEARGRERLAGDVGDVRGKIANDALRVDKTGPLGAGRTKSNKLHGGLLQRYGACPANGPGLARAGGRHLARRLAYSCTRRRSQGGNFGAGCPTGGAEPSAKAVDNEGNALQAGAKPHIRPIGARPRGRKRELRRLRRATSRDRFRRPATAPPHTPTP